MGVIRVNKNKDYTTMSNYHFRDKELSLRAKGLLSQMLSLPEDWDYSIEGLASLNKEGIKAIRSTLQELEDRGYLIRTRVNDEKGHFAYVYDIFEKPQTENSPYYPQGHAVQGHAVQGHALKDRQLNTKELNTKELNTKDVKKERKSSSYNEIIDTLVIDPKLKEALIEFIKMRKLSKKPPTDHALELLIKKLYKLSSDPQTQIAIVEQSILNNWQAFYPLKLDDKNKNGYSERGTSRDKQYSELEQRIINFGSRSE